MEALGDLRTVVGVPWSEVILMLVSLFCGALVGIERERQEKPAGLRTMMLICLGSTTFTVASMTPVLGHQEPGRIAAQIVTGVGFLGAGSILRDRNGIRGLTTAASIWATAAVGIVVGAGYAVAGFGLALLVLLTLGGVARAEEWLTGRRCDRTSITVLYHPDRGKTRARILHLLEERRGSPPAAAERLREDGAAALTIEHCTFHREHRSLLARIAELPGVQGFE